MLLKSFINPKLKELNGEGKGVAVFATLNVIDKDEDVTMPGAFGEQEVKLLPTHDWGHVPIGKAKIFERNDKAVAEFQINMDLQSGKEWHSALKFDLENGTPIQEWSYGFSVEKQSFGDFEGRDVRFLEKLKVHEVSPVVVGAGEGTGTLAVKSAGQTLKDQIDTVISDIKHIIWRSKQVKAKRQEQGKKHDFSQDRSLQIDSLVENIKSLQEISNELQEFATAHNGKDGEVDTDKAASLYAQYLSIQSNMIRGKD